MITPGSTKSDLEPVLRDRRQAPIEISVGNPFVPTSRLILSTPAEKDKGITRFTLKHQEGGKVVASDQVGAVRDNHLRFARVDVSRRPTSPSAVDNLGAAHLSRGELDEAEKCFRRALELRPEFVPALAHLAKVRLVQGRMDEAASIYWQLRESRPTDRDVIVNVAAIEMQQGKAERALEVLEGAVAKGLVDEHIFNALGVARLLTRDVNGAIKYFRLALRENVRFLPAQNNIGATYQLAGNYMRAERALKTSLTLDTGSASATKNLAELYLSKRKYKEAIAVLGPYVKKEGGDVEARATLGLCLLEAGNYDRAVEEFRGAIKESERGTGEPMRLATLYNNLGVAYQSRGEADAAQECFEAAIGAAPNGNRRILYNLMNLHARRRNVGQLGLLIQRAESAYAGDARVDLFRSRYYALRGDYDAAMEAGRIAMERLTDSVEPHCIVAAIAGEVLGDYESAIEVTRAGLERDSRNRMLLNNLAYYLLMKGDVKGGREILDSVTEGDDDVFFRATRGLLLFREGNVREGARLYNEAWRLAQGGELKGLVAQKKDLELAKLAIAQGRRSEAESLLKRAIVVKSGEATYRDQARRLLRTVRSSVEE